MTVSEVKKLRKQIEAYLAEHRIFDALDALANCTRATMLFELTDRVEKLRQTYRYMLQYLTQGIDDPGRERLLADIYVGAYSVLDLFDVEVSSRETPTLYYNIRRFNRQQGCSNTVAVLIDRWQKVRRQASSMSALFAEASQRGTSTATTVETVETELFNAVWTSFPLDSDSAGALTDLICDAATPAATAVRLTSALMIAAQEFADPEVLKSLCDIYTSFSQGEDDKSRGVAATALLAILFALYKYNDRVLPLKVSQRIEAMDDVPTWGSDVRNAFMELVRSRDTERISRTMTDEIMPQMMAMKSDIEKKVRDIGERPLVSDLEDHNPDWEDLFSNSEIGDKLKELNRMQMEGSDVYMSTFAHLKNFPFFNDLINWFTPFTTDNYNVEKIVDSSPALADVALFIGSLPFLCDSDRFSVLFSINLINDTGRQAMLSQLAEQRDEILELKTHAEGVTRSDMRKADLRNVIRNFYRFVNLFRRKGEFYNIFSHEINLFDVPLLSGALRQPEILKIIGEFYFRYKYYTESLTAFCILDEMGEFDAVLYQKMGYAYEHTDNLEKAVLLYEQAELLDGSSRWLQYRLADTYRKSGRLSEAVDKLRRLSEQYPDDFETILKTGQTLIEADNLREALRYLYRAEYLREDSTEVCRALGRTLFMVREYEKATVYFDRLLNLSPTPEDYFDMGHLALARKNYKEAINYYRTFIEKSASGTSKAQTFRDAFDAAVPNLLRAGIDKEIIPLVADAVMSGEQ